MAGSGGTEWAEGAAVWFQPPGASAPLPGQLVEVHRAARVLLVSAVVNSQPQTFALQMGTGEEEGDPVWPREELGPTGVEDMTRLHDLHEAALLWNLKLRYEQGLIYTYAGSILVAVNPYRPVDALYGLQTARRYHAAEALGDLPPHLFAIAAAARASLPHPQAILISGESGAGKTESTKLAVQFLAAVAPAPPGRAPVSEQILEAAPLLEAFGNARTPKNHNSSRFGKLLELYFKDGALAGARVAHYLLEKSRIVTQSPGERNYHVFYELLAGLDEEQRKARGLLSAEHYFYLNQGGDSGGAGAGADWSALCGAMQVLGIGDAEREDIIRVLAAVLHLGNVYFHRRQLRHGQEGVQLGGGAEVRWAAHLLKVPAEAMARALTTRVTAARAERMRSPLPIDQALDARDAFAKALYSSLFNWLVLRINSIVHRAGLHDAHRISLLDIFGFEDLEENSFEQLCINFANETLQHYFNKHIFKLEQQEYQKERLEWSNLAWNDNSPVIQLLSKKPVGILHLLDDESNFPRASDASFLEKCHYNHALNELYSRPRLGASEFGVKHYAGQVWYNVEGFLDKNRDALRGDVLELLCSSEVPLVAEMSAQLRAQHDANKTLPRGANGRFVTMKPRTPTVAARFSDSLHQLLDSMSRCNPWFVRCIKPNTDKSPMRYLIGGKTLPHFTPWVIQNLNIDITKPPKTTPLPASYPDSRLPSNVREELEEIALVSVEGMDRLIRAHGQTLSDMAQLRSHSFPRIPDAVVWPECHDHVVKIVALATRHQFVIIPFGGGTSVSGSITCPAREPRPIVALDTSEMNSILWIDRDQLLARVQTGIVGQDLEREMRARGLTVGHEPDSYEFSTLGGWVATRASGMKKNTYGNIEDLIVQTKTVTPTGVLEKSCRVPRISCGPEWEHVIMGSEGCFGVVTEVTIKVRPLPAVTRYGSLVFPAWENGVAFEREVAEKRLQPSSIRLMDNDQFRFGHALKFESSWGGVILDGLKQFYITRIKGFDPEKLCVVTLLFEGEADEVTEREKRINAIATKYGGVPAGATNGERGYTFTFVIAYIRDLALDYSVVAESFETSVPWDRTLALCAAVKRRVRAECERRGVQHYHISCRLTQTYDAGCCIYFYFGFNSSSFKDPVTMYEEIEEAARDEIIDCGGSISHHHGVGKLRKKWYKDTVSEPGRRLLLAAKKTLDPDNIFALGNMAFGEDEHENTKIKSKL